MSTVARCFASLLLILVPAFLLQPAYAQAEIPRPATHHSPLTTHQADVPRPAPPREFAVQLHYRIFAGRNERLKQYFALLNHLESIGFAKDPGAATEPEDPGETRMTGTIPSANARTILLAPNVKAILLVPAEIKLPEEGTVKVQIELASGLPLDRQLLLADQVRGKLADLGFRENVGYDERGHTRLLGSIPVNELDTLLQDMRWQPSGWLLPALPFADLPLPLRNVSPILITEVLPEPEGVPPARPAPAAAMPFAKEEEHLQKISPDLRARAAQEGADKLSRIEVVLDHTPAEDDQRWRRPLAAAAPGLAIEGRLGPVVTVLAAPQHAPALAGLPLVSTIRLPRPALPQVLFPKGLKVEHSEVLKTSGFLHALAHRGGIRVAVIDGDFRGYQALAGKKKFPRLPRNTHYVDLTAERNSNLVPDEFPGDPEEIGNGTACALAVSLAVPHADLTLVRVDPACPHQLAAVARAMNGAPFRSESHGQRLLQLEEEQTRLANQKARLLLERRLVLNNYDTEKDAQDKRAAYFKNQEAFDAEERAYYQLVERFLQLQKDYRDLRHVQAAVCTLVWNEGYPLGGASPLTHTFDDHPFKNTLWFQSAGTTRGQIWSGLFRDSDGNGVMEFTPPGTALGPERWSAELNFLAWQPHAQGPKEAATRALPEKLPLRLTMQWREVHDPEFFRDEGDVYRAPRAQLHMMILTQRDPKGEKLAADELEVVARSAGWPHRLENHPTYAIYEQAFELIVDRPGCYALRVEGRVPAGIRPAAAPTLPVMARSWELRPRIFVDVHAGQDPQNFRNLGRVVFLDFATDADSLGMPADSRGVTILQSGNDTSDKMTR